MKFSTVCLTLAAAAVSPLPMRVAAFGVGRSPTLPKTSPLSINAGRKDTERLSLLKFPTKMKKEGTMEIEKYERKCPFRTTSEASGIKIDNTPGFIERVFIRTFHFLQRKIVQYGALKSWNPITKLFSIVFYGIDLLWAGVDKQYYVKRHAMYGPNFISTLSVVVSKYDEHAHEKDSIDAKLLTYPQRREFFLGSTIMNPATQYYYGEADKNGKKKSIVPLFVSDPGATINPALSPDQLDHVELRNFLMKNILGADKVEDAIKRQTDTVGSNLLKEFGAKAKGKSGDELKKEISDFLGRFIIYILFDVPWSEVPIDVLNETIFSKQYVLNLYGPGWLGISSRSKKPIRRGEEVFKDFISQHSGVLRSVEDEPNGLTKEDLCEAIIMPFSIAAFQGTKALAGTSMTQMPKSVAESVLSDDEKLRHAILECARMDTPVTGAHQIVDDDEGLTTEIGGKKLKFPKGTVVFTSFTNANLDEERFPNPFVFDPDSRDFSKLTSFNSIGEKTYDNSPRICPGREIAIAIVSNMIKAKAEAE